MNTRRTPRMFYSRVLRLLSLSCLLFAAGAVAAHAQSAPSIPTTRQAGAGTGTTTAGVPGTPAETVRAFYKAFRQRRFRDAWMLTIFKKAVEDLTAEEFEELRPDFERVAAALRDEIEIVGEQLGDKTATIFAKIATGDDSGPPEQVTLLRAGGAWVIGEESQLEEIKKKGKGFFFTERIETHHAEVQTMMQRILAAELIYSSQHGGEFTDLNGLIRAGLVPQDLLGTETTGYRFHIELEKGNKSYIAGAEPARYGRTGLLSFHLNKFGVKSKDTGGKPFKPSPAKK